MTDVVLLPFIGRRWYQVDGFCPRCKEDPTVMMESWTRRTVSVVEMCPDCEWASPPEVFDRGECPEPEDYDDDPWDEDRALSGYTYGSHADRPESNAVMRQEQYVLDMTPDEYEDYLSERRGA